MLALSLAPLRKLFSFRKPKKISDNDNPPPPVEPSAPGTPIPDVCAMLPESHPVIRPSPLEEPSNLPLEARIVGRPPKSRFVGEPSTTKALPAVPQEIGNRGQGGRWGPARLDRELSSAMTGVRYILANAARALPIQTGPIDVDTLPEITVDDPEAASVEALSSHLKGPSAVANGYSPFILRSPGAVLPPAETSQQGLLLNALRLHAGNSHVRRFVSEDVESTLGDTGVHPSADVSESDASVAFQTNPAGACVVGGLWTNTAATSTGSSDSSESDKPKGAAPPFKYTGPYVHTTPAPIELPAPPGLDLRLPPGLPLPLSELRLPEALFPPITNPGPATTPSSPPYEVRYLERGSADARRQQVLIGKGASAEVFRVASPNGMYRVIKVVNLKKVDLVSLEALKTELTVLTIIKRDQMDVMHCIKKPKPGLEFVMQIPLDIPNYIAIKGGAKQLIMYSEYYPENLDMFSGVIPQGTPAALMKNILYFIISEITQGLAYLHRQHVVHMDLKLENIFLTASRHCVIGDFGGAIHAVDQLRLSQPGVPAHFQTYTTHGFRAPEVSAVSVDPQVPFHCKADFWSLGVCVYKLLVPDGVWVKAGETGNDYMKMGLMPWVMRERLREAGCPEEIVELVLNMTQLDPVRRMGEKGITRHLKKRNRYYKRHHPSPLQLLTPEENHIRTSRFQMRPTGSGDDPELYLSTERVTSALIYNMREFCAQELVTYD